MNIKEELLKLKNGLLVRKDIDDIKNKSTKEENNIPEDTKKETLKGEYETYNLISARLRNLDDKVDNFINWYFNNFVKGNYTSIGEYSKPREMRDLIEKVAVWYELRYPEYEVNRLMPGSSQERTEINDIMFNNNLYFNDTYDDSSKKINWADFYNKDVFINSLPCEEKFMFQSTNYSSIVYLNNDELNLAHLHLTPNGIVEMAEGFNYLQKENSNNVHINLDSYFEGKHIKNVVEYLKSNNISLTPNNGFEEAIKWHDKWTFLKDEFLNCVMYRIIERGENRIGPRRAFLFAKEFNRSIDIPMMYGVDTSDPGLRLFVDEYIKAGGSKDLVCYINYFSRSSKNENLEIIKVSKIIEWSDNVEKHYSNGRQFVK